MWRKRKSGEASHQFGVSCQPNIGETAAACVKNRQNDNLNEEYPAAAKSAKLCRNRRKRRNQRQSAAWQYLQRDASWRSWRLSSLA
jgi:hypothetical protein